MSEVQSWHIERMAKELDAKDALLGEMAAALKSLANEASIGVDVVRFEWGNTNANCLQRRIDQSRALLSSDAAQAALREREELLRDRERPEWLEQRREYPARDGVDGTHILPMEWRSHRTLRQAIDAAMGKDGGLGATLQATPERTTDSDDAVSG
jgi:hypothetical protein